MSPRDTGVGDLDLDLQSRQAARRLARAAREAQRTWATASQAEVDRVCAAMAKAALDASARLADLAHEETGMGVAAHKKIKNDFAADNVWASIRDVPTVGVLRRDDERRIVEIGWPVGVIAALTPVTNPTSTVIFKVLIGVKARNAVVVAPHPRAQRCAAETVRTMAAAGEAVGMPRGLIGSLDPVALAGTQELMGLDEVSMILATGGGGMVRAAHGYGKPAIGVGPGNVPAYVDRSADLAKAAWDIVNSKAFDCSVICSTEQSVVADRPIAAELRALMQANGAHFLTPAEADALEATIFAPRGAMLPDFAGRPATELAARAGIAVPDGTRVLVVDAHGVGPDHPYSREKLAPVLAFYEEDGWRAGCERCIELLEWGGPGHSLVIHCTDEDVILAFGIEKPAFRIIVNSWGTLGAIGATTGVAPSMTLAPGGLGGAVVSDNITVHHVLNVKRLAYEKASPPPGAAATPAPTAVPAAVAASATASFPGPSNGVVTDEALAEIVQRVVAEMGLAAGGDR